MSTKKTRSRGMYDVGLSRWLEPSGSDGTSIAQTYQSTTASYQNQILRKWLSMDAERKKEDDRLDWQKLTDQLMEGWYREQAGSMPHPKIAPKKSPKPAPKPAPAKNPRVYEFNPDVGF